MINTIFLHFILHRSVLGSFLKSWVDLEEVCKVGQTNQRAQEEMEAEYFLKSHLFMIFLELMICFWRALCDFTKEGFPLY